MDGSFQIKAQADTAFGHRLRRIRASVLFTVLGGLGLVGCGRNEFVPYSPSAELVPALEGAVVHLGGFTAPELGSYWARGGPYSSWDPGPSASEWREVFQVVAPDRSRVVSFATLRVNTRQEFDERIEDFRESWSEDDLAIGEEILVELTPLDGLPDGALTAHWSATEYKSRDGWATVVGDRDRQLMMIVIWVEDPDLVPTDGFVDVVNTAWSDFRSDNVR